MADITAVDTAGTDVEEEEALVPADQALVMEDLLVEDVSIDGMCGVY